MTTDDAPPPRDTLTATRRRNAAGTRHLLLHAARHRFASDGYAATTVRNIADEAGVNVALINRYFHSKEGLFEACLTSTVDDVRFGDARHATLDQVADTIARQLTGSPAGSKPVQLLLLLRSSGDRAADEIRRGIIESFAERLAVAAGHTPGEPDEQLLLRAQIVLSAALGAALLRATVQMEPLASADAQQLREPLRDLITGMLRDY